jgi:hypothetical protein
MKRFSALEEIEREPGYAEKNPIHLGVYRRLYGWYSFAEGLDVECCVQKPNGNLCDRKHRRGWVAQLHDDSLTIVGGDCAREKFGADSIIAQDISRATNEIDRLEKLARLEELLLGRDKAMEEIARLKGSLVAAKKRVAGHLENLGPHLARTLVSMSRANLSVIAVLGIVPEVLDADGETVRDRRERDIPIATLASLSACNPSFVESILDDLRGVERAYARSRSVPVSEMKPKDVRLLNAALADEPRITLRATEYLTVVERFEANDFTPLCFAVSDKAERLKIARYGLERQGAEAGKEAAKAWIQSRESELKVRFEVSLIRTR